MRRVWLGQHFLAPGPGDGADGAEGRAGVVEVGLEQDAVDAYGLADVGVGVEPDRFERAVGEVGIQFVDQLEAEANRADELVCGPGVMGVGGAPDGVGPDAVCFEVDSAGRAWPPGIAVRVLAVTLLGQARHGVGAGDGGPRQEQAPWTRGRGEPSGRVSNGRTSCRPDPSRLQSCRP